MNSDSGTSGIVVLVLAAIVFLILMGSYAPWASDKNRACKIVCGKLYKAYNDYRLLDEDTCQCYDGNKVIKVKLGVLITEKNTQSTPENSN